MSRVEMQTTRYCSVGSYYTDKTVGYCSKCSREVWSSQYGFDEECPDCGAELDWSEEEGEEE